MSYLPWIIVRKENGDFAAKSKEELLDSDTVIQQCNRLTDAWRRVSELTAQYALTPTRSHL